MDDPRIVELLTEMLVKQDSFIQEQKKTNDRLGSMDGRLEHIEKRLERVEKQQQTTNLKLQELTLSNVRLADELKIVAQQGERIMRLEAAVFH
ncbi:MAG TPA: hypothetical protein VFD13_10110 [Candidatus Kapabacteria bacterium]|nr:hypothetical protein [Candidatus Kapabacteria bacterium]